MDEHVEILYTRLRFDIQFFLQHEVIFCWSNKQDFTPIVFSCMHQSINRRFGIF